MSKKNSAKKLEEQITTRLSHLYGISPAEATDEQYYEIVATIARDMAREKRRLFDAEGKKNGDKRIYYLSMEFLMGRSLKNTLYNLSITDEIGRAHV